MTQALFSELDQALHSYEREMRWAKRRADAETKDFLDGEIDSSSDLREKLEELADETLPGIAAVLDRCRGHLEENASSGIVPDESGALRGEVEGALGSLRELLAPNPSEDAKEGDPGAPAGSSPS